MLAVLAGPCEPDIVMNWADGVVPGRCERDETVGQMVREQAVVLDVERFSRVE